MTWTVKPLVLAVLYAIAYQENPAWVKFLRPAYSNLHGVVLRG